MQGSFFWYDLMTTDTAAAAQFYGDVVGWTAADSGTPGHNYAILSTQGHGVAGLMTIPDDVAKAGGRPFWMGYIHVEDVDAMCARIVQEGGAVHRTPTDVPGVIRFAVVADPQGAPFLIARPAPQEQRPQPAPGAAGTVGWRELYAEEWQSAFAFYEKLFGWTRGDSFDMGPMGSYQLFHAGGGEAVGGMMTRPPQAPRPFWGFYFLVPSVGAALDKIAAAGGAVRMGPQQVPGGQWIVQAMDPQGAPFALLSAEK